MPRADTMNAKVLAHLKDRGPGTTWDISEALKEPRRRVQNALASLQDLGRVRRGEVDGQRQFRRGATPHVWEPV